MKITPLGNRILVKRVTAKVTTSSGILLPESSIEKPLEGTVVALSRNNYSENGKLQEFNVSVGDRVTFASWGSELDIKLDDDDYAFINEDTIIGVLR